MTKTINLINLEESNVKYDIFKFNDGEIHIKFIDEIAHKDEYNVITRITSMDELFVLLQVGNILDRHAVKYNVYITYLMGMRMDRVMTFNEAFSLEIIANMLNSIHPNTYNIFEPHSERTIDLINNATEYDMLENTADILRLYNKLSDNDYMICFPDHGADVRYSMNYAFFDNPMITLGKTRNVETGEITGMEIVNYPSKICSNIIIIDDLCDGGRTFIEAYKLLKSEYPDASIDIFVKHMVNPKGLENLKNTFNHVYITNSYADYKSHDNVTVFSL